MNEKKITRARPPKLAGVMLETILGCKWSLTVYSLIDDGITRPGAMERSVDGLTTKVLNDCLRRNIELGLLEKVGFPEIPPRVEYRFTPLGFRFKKVLAAVDALQVELENLAPEGRRREPDQVDGPGGP